MAEKKDNLLFFETTGLSMWPFLKGNERLIVKRTPSFDLKPGDLVLYKTNEQSICHRFIKRTKINDRHLLYVKADASTALPELVSEEMFLGKVIGVIKDNKVINFEGARQRLINRIILIAAPLRGFMSRAYRVLSGRR